MLISFFFFFVSIATIREQLHSANIAARVLSWRSDSALYLRAIANLSFDTSQFVSIAFESGLITRVRQALLGATDEAQVRSAMGALANFAAAQDNVVDAMFDDALGGFLSQLLARATQSPDDVDDMTVSLALQLVGNVAQTPAFHARLRPVARAALPFARTLLADVDQLESSWTEKLLALYTTLAESPEFVDLIVELAEPLARAAAMPPASADGATHQDEDGRFLAASLLMTSAAHSNLHRDALFHAAGWKAIAFELLASERILHRKVRPALVKALAELSLSDALADEFLSGGDLLRLVDIAVNSGVPDVRVSAAIAVGNVARTDVRAAQLINEHNIVDRLIALVDARREVAPDMRVPHAVVGALANLVVSPPNKARIGRHPSLFAHVRKWLELPNALVQFAVVLLLRSVASERHCRAQLVQNGLLGALASVASDAGYVQDDSAGTMTVEGESEPRRMPAAETSSDKPRDMRVQYECARVLARLCAPPAATSDNAADDSVVDVTLADIAAVGAAKHFDMLAQTPHVILQAEGLLALQKLVAVDASLTEMAKEAARHVLRSDPVAHAASTEASAPTPAHHQADLQMARAAVTAADELLALN